MNYATSGTDWVSVGDLGNDLQIPDHYFEQDPKLSVLLGAHIEAATSIVAEEIRRPLVVDPPKKEDHQGKPLRHRFVAPSSDASGPRQFTVQLQNPADIKLVNSRRESSIVNGKMIISLGLDLICLKNIMPGNQGERPVCVPGDFTPYRQMNSDLSITFWWSPPTGKRIEPSEGNVYILEYLPAVDPTDKVNEGIRRCIILVAKRLYTGEEISEDFRDSLTYILNPYRYYG